MLFVLVLFGVFLIVLSLFFMLFLVQVCLFVVVVAFVDVFTALSLWCVCCLMLLCVVVSDPFVAAFGDEPLVFPAVLFVLMSLMLRLHLSWQMSLLLYELRLRFVFLVLLHLLLTPCLLLLVLLLVCLLLCCSLLFCVLFVFVLHVVCCAWWCCVLSSMRVVAVFDVLFFCV